MSYEFLPDQMYLMPTHFGPALGPRQNPEGGRFPFQEDPKSTTYMVNFLSDAQQLKAMLPPGFELTGEPVVTVSLTYMTEIGWLAGRGYAMLGLTIPATFHGQQETVTGDFLTVLWENRTEPIITGREELGFSKIYCALPDPLVYRGRTHCTASWDGYKFMDLTVENLRALTPAEIGAVLGGRRSAGYLHYKYMPRTGEWGVADAAYATLSPSGASNQKLEGVWAGEGSVHFHAARWEDMPTQYRIVNAFHALPMLEARGALMLKAVGGTDMYSQRILR